MKAHEIKAGDQLVEFGLVTYTVEEVVDVVPSHVKARVRYELDMTTGLRAWDPYDEVPLTRAEA